MKLSIDERNRRLFYKIENADAALDKAISGLGYLKSGDSYIKSFPPVFPYRDKIVGNFLKNGEAVFHDEAGLEPLDWRAGFEHFVSIAEAHHINWWTTGKILLPLNGIDSDIDDVDFYFHEEDLAAVYDAFSDYIVEPIVAESHRSKAFKYAGLAYSHCPICMLVEPLASLDEPEPVHFGQYASKNLVTVDWNGYTIKVPSIDLYIKTLKRWGKTEFAETIAQALCEHRRA